MIISTDAQNFNKFDIQFIIRTLNKVEEEIDLNILTSTNNQPIASIILNGQKL